MSRPNDSIPPLPALRRRLAGRSLLVPLALAMTSGPALADPVTDRQATIALRALAYDNNLGKRAGNEVTVAVLFKEGSDSSAEMAQKWAEAFGKLSSFKVQGKPFRVVKLAYAGTAPLRTALDTQGIDALFVCDGLDAELEALKAFSRGSRLLTLAGSSAFVERGVSLGVVLLDNKNTLIINSQANAAEGVAFSSDLLRLAKDVTKPGSR